MNETKCDNECKNCLLNECCALQYARSVGIAEHHIQRMSELSRKMSEKINGLRKGFSEQMKEEIIAGFDRMFLSQIDKEKDSFFDEYSKPDIFNLAQTYEMLAAIGDKFDLKEMYYQKQAEIVIKDKEEFRRRIIAGEALALKIHSLILQRADQLLKAVNAVCTKNGVCDKCWLTEVCKAKAEKEVR